MLSALAALAVLLLPAAVVVAALLAIERHQRARADVVARQIILTDAIHAELGAIVAPVVEKRPFQPWRVVFALPEERVREMARLIAITERVFSNRMPASDDVDIVFTRRASAPRALAA
jgi:hypothetical protein